MTEEEIRELDRKLKELNEKILEIVKLDVRIKALEEDYLEWRKGGRMN